MAVVVSEVVVANVTELEAPQSLTVTVTVTVGAASVHVVSILTLDVLNSK